jgi:hypothetical protein
MDALIYRTLGTQSSWLKWLTRCLYCPFIYSVGNFLSISLQERISLRNVLIWLHRMDSISLLMDLFARADILNAKESYALGSHATVFQSEVYSILACSKYCISEGNVNRAISICSDSRAALSYAVSSRVQYTDSLQELALSNRVRLVWVLNFGSIFNFFYR